MQRLDQKKISNTCPVFTQIINFRHFRRSAENWRVFNNFSKRRIIFILLFMNKINQEHQINMYHNFRLKFDIGMYGVQLILFERLKKIIK